MIEIKLTGICEGCPRADIGVEIEAVHADENFSVTMVDYKAICKNEDFCKWVSERTIDFSEKLAHNST